MDSDVFFFNFPPHVSRQLERDHDLI